MNNDNMTDGISDLISQEIHSKDKIYKPDFNQKTGRELLAFYLQTKFKQILAYDKKADIPVFINIKPDFIARFSKRLINNPNKRFLIGITGESASGKSTICNEIENVIKNFELPVSIITTDNYFNDISDLISKYGGFDNLRDNGYDIDSPQNFQLELLRQDLEKISMGEDIYTPEYLPNGTGVSVPLSKFVKSEKIIVVEGTKILIYFHLHTLEPNNLIVSRYHISISKYTDAPRPHEWKLAVAGICGKALHIKKASSKTSIPRSFPQTSILKIECLYRTCP